MEQDDFLKKLFSLYASTFNKGNGAAWAEAYKQVLKPNIDYDKLYNFVLTNYAGVSAPSPAFLLKNAIYINSKVIACKVKETDTIEAEINGRIYEFALDCAFGEARTRLEQRGFKNIRYKFNLIKKYE